jgi:hypothetical protein
MHVKLGTTLDGQTAHLDTSTPSLTLLLADPGNGKTTLARYLTRWWLARSDTTVTVYALRPHEWTDLAEHDALHLRSLEDGMSPAHSPGSGLPGPGSPTHLTVLDGVDTPGLGPILGLPDPRDLVIATAVSAWLGADLVEATHQAPVLRWGLLPASATEDHVRATTEPTHTNTDPRQSRLDWGAETLPLWPTRRGPRDHPCHRWVSCGVVPAAFGTLSDTAVRDQTPLGDVKRPREIGPVAGRVLGP